MENIKPSTFAGKFPWGSRLQNRESETVARNIMVILERRGDTWEKLDWETYLAERMNDGADSQINERGLFEKVYPLISNAAGACGFSPAWTDAARNK